MRKLAIFITALLLCGVLVLMLASIGLVELPFIQPTKTRQTATSASPAVKLRETRDHTAEVRAKLRAETSLGSITVKGADVEQVQITMFVEAGADDQARAQQILDAVSLDITTAGNENRLIVRTPNQLGSNEQARVDLTILVPRATELDLRSSLGAVEVIGMQGALKAETNLGSITVVDYEGSAQLTTSLGSITASSSRFTDKLTVTAEMGSINIVGHLAKNNVFKVSMGDVQLHLLGDESYLLEGKVSMGGIYVWAPFEGKQTGDSVKGTIGQGERRGSISADVSMGSLRISN